MGMTAFYGNFDRAAHEETSLQTIGRALELGVNFLDTAWIYQVSSLSISNAFDDLAVVRRWRWRQFHQ
jgi:aryl-alcohol dehydrogenase-like predicted oxidoreductase